MTSRWNRTEVLSGAAYDQRFERLARAGHDVHAEASFVMGFQPRTVLDAGCGTGRVAVELWRRGVAVVGVDVDRSALETACEKAPDVEWFRSDLARLFVPGSDPVTDRLFDVAVMAGNVMIFVEDGSERAVLDRVAAHVRPGGVLVCGFQLTRGHYGVVDHDRDCAAVGLELVERFASWSRDPWTIESGYAVSVHSRPEVTERDSGSPTPGGGAGRRG